MFENIIGQTNTINSLKSDLVNNNFPPAVLFHGPDYGGKLSTALEIARILNCKAQPDWNCACHSCAQHRLLIHPNLQLLGARDFTTEIAAAADVLLRTGKISARYFFIRAVRKQLKGFDPVLWQGDESKIKSYQQTVQDIEDELTRFLPETGEVQNGKSTDLNRILTLCTKLSGSSKTGNTPVNQVRNAVFWAHHSAVGGKKVIILENADKMLDASRNALLKILEEPPRDLEIILLTTNKGAIIRTILSRVRPYLFLERTKAESGEILAKIFKEQNPEFTRLRDYFLAWKDLNPALLKGLAHKFIGLVLDTSLPVPDIIKEMNELFTTAAPRDALLSFFEELYGYFHQTLSSSLNNQNAHSLGLIHMENWAGILRDSLYQVEHLNLSPKNILEYVYFKFRMSL